VWWYFIVGITTVVGSLVLRLSSPERATAAVTLASGIGISGILLATRSGFDLIKLRAGVLKTRLELQKLKIELNEKESRIIQPCMTWLDCYSGIVVTARELPGTPELPVMAIVATRFT
jgi:hypothetical protein